MNRAHQSARNYLSISERERLKRQIEFEKQRLRGGLILPASRVNKMENVSERMMHRMSQFMDQGIQEDKSLINHKVRKLERILSDGTPGRLTSMQRVKLEKKAASLRDYLKNKLCPRSLYFKKSKDPEFEQAVQACTIEQTAEFTHAAQTYKNAMRQLSPDDPDASNVEKLRPN